VRDHTFGKYQLVAELGQGGMADVILAVARGPVGFHKLVVIKRLRYHLADDPEFVAMLVDEARLAARLNHPNIVHTNEVGEVDGRFFIAMEYLEGQPLTRLKRRATRQGTPLSRETEIRIIADVLAGLHHAHELSDYDGKALGVVHRDMSPSNVFVTYDGIVKIVDFGIAKAAGRTTETRTGVVKGKMTYMPPEQALGLEVDRRADLFSAGVMLWEAVTGERMWKGLDDVVILGRLINGDIPVSPRDVHPDVPEALDRLCRKALAPDPAHRFESALEFQNELESFLETFPHQPTNRELGRLTGQLFERDRLEIKSIIEGQLSKIGDSLLSSLEPVVIPDSLRGSGSHPSLTLTEVSPSAQVIQSPFPDGLVSATAVGAQKPARRSSALVLVAAAALAAAGAVWFFRSGLDTPPDAGTPPSRAEIPPTASATSSVEKPSKVRITLRAAPASARFSIDDGALLDNPYVGEIDRNGDQHQIRVEATGYMSRLVNVTFDRDVLVDLALKKDERAVVQPATRPPAAAPQPLPAAPPAKRPPREIFTDDPWE